LCCFGHFFGAVTRVQFITVWWMKQQRRELTALFVGICASAVFEIEIKGI